MDSEIALYSDLQKLILESLLDNFSNALKCCLVCKDWQLFCRPRIFKALEFASPQGKERFHGFVELLAAPVIPTFVPYVEHITLDDRLEPEDIEALDSGKLVKLYSLSVKYQTKELGPSSDYFKAISKEFPQIIHLDIAGAALIMRKTLTDFICSFHRLQKLALGDASCLGVLMNAHREIEERHWILPPLKSLCLSMNLGATFEETFLHWLANQLRSQKSLQTLRLLGVVTQPDRIQALMECVSPYLEELELDIRPFSLLNAVSTVFSERIDDLDITGLVFPSPTALVQFLCAFPRLKQLSLGDNAFASTPTYGNQLVVPPNLHLSSNLASLRISQELGIADSSVLSWVLGQLKKHGSLKKLEYRANGWFTVFPEDLLMGVAETVEELDLYFVSTDTTSLQLLCSPDLTFSNLQTLRLMCTLSQVELVSDWQGLQPEHLMDYEHAVDPSPHSSSSSPSLPLCRDGHDNDDFIIDTGMDGVLGKLISSLSAPELTKIALTFLPKVTGKWNEEVCTMHILRSILFGEFDKALVERNSANALPMLKCVEFLAEGCTGGKGGDSQCFAFGGRDGKPRVFRQLHQKPGQTFDSLAGEFLESAFSSSLAKGDVNLQVSEIAVQ
ncbi:hypothetical protein EST38_g5388 [Candolleomyces aberdarensis]|uniref:Uncharacterized protein n=1 Tax=Candolleomyces aberdarensis TaxID=2316362 RepID=A0A4Q2DNS4_9AGAR|nr:hypothetical protein EST38_g5388 [Candolleomyces aberdarensis]